VHSLKSLKLWESQDLHKVLVDGGYLVVLFRPDVWSKDDIYGYRAALDSPAWRKISGKS
jgi:hypothetical protein